MQEKDPFPHPLIADSIDQLIGNTPMLKLNRVTEGCLAQVVAKLESHCPAGSVKDRIAKSMVDEAEKRGEIKPGDTIVEATSGNTGIALAMVCAARGYKHVSVMPDSFSMERRMMIKAYGAELVLTPASQSIQGSFAMVDKICKERGAHSLQQFKNFDNPLVHRETTGPEIWKQTQGKIDIFVSGVGTGGTITGASQYLKGMKPDMKSVAVEPAESQVMAGGKKGPHSIQGIGAGFVPEILDLEIVDEIMPVTSYEATSMAQRLASEEGLMTGFSGGAAVQAAIELAKRPVNAGKLIVVIIPSYGERYLSTDLFSKIRDECNNMITEEA